MDNIWEVNLADIQLIHKYNKRIYFSLSVIDIYRNTPLKDKKGEKIIKAFQKFVKESNCKLKKIWVDKGSLFYNRIMKSRLNENDAKTYSTHKQGKFVAEEWFIGYLKNEFTNIWQQTSKKVYINKLPEIVDEYNNTTLRNIKLKPVDVKRNTYISFVVQFNGKKH